MRKVGTAVALAAGLVGSNAYAATGSFSSVTPPFGTTTSMTVDPSNASVVYATTNDYRVFKSSDGGASWTTLRLTPDITITDTVLGVAVDPTNASIVYAGTQTSGVYKSTDGGATWATVNGSFPNGSVSSQPFSRADRIVCDGSGNVFAHVWIGTASATLDDYGIWELPVGTSTWVDASTGLPGIPRIGQSTAIGAVVSLARSPSGSIYAGAVQTGTSGGLNVYAWGGASFGSSSPTYASLSINDLAVDGSGAIYVSGDNAGMAKLGGGMWTSPYLNPQGYSMVIDAAGDFFDCTGSAINSMAAGLNTTPWTMSSSDTPFVTASLPQNNGYVLATVGTTLYAGATGGPKSAAFTSPTTAPTWTRMYPGNISGPPLTYIDGAFCAFSIDGPSCTTNGGATWTTSTADGVPTSSIYGMAVDPTSTSTYYIGTFTGLYRSAGGAAYAATDLVSPCGSSFAASGTTRYVGGQGYVYTSTNGTNWTPLGTGLLASVPVTQLTVAPSDPTVIIGMQNAIGYRLTAGTWTANTNLQFAFAFDPTNASTIYTVSGNAVGKSTDGGGTIGQLSTGLPGNAAIRALAVDPTRPQVVYAGLSTNNSGPVIYRSLDGAATFAPLITGLPPAASITAIADLHVSAANPATLLAGLSVTSGTSTLFSITQTDLPGLAGDAGAEAGVDAGVDAGHDAGVDAGPKSDASVVDASSPMDAAAVDSGTASGPDAADDSGGFEVDASTPPPSSGAGGGGRGGMCNLGSPTGAPWGAMGAGIASALALLVARRRRR